VESVKAQERNNDVQRSVEEQRLQIAIDRATSYEAALVRIANMDYRGSRSRESQIAEMALRMAKR
jgi:hypothetical protein